MPDCVQLQAFVDALPEVSTGDDWQKIDDWAAWAGPWIRSNFSSEAGRFDQLVAPPPTAIRVAAPAPPGPRIENAMDEYPDPHDYTRAKSRHLRDYLDSASERSNTPPDPKPFVQKRQTLWQFLNGLLLACPAHEAPAPSGALASLPGPPAYDTDSTQWQPVSPPLQGITPEELKALKGTIPVLLVTANKHELNALLRRMTPFVGRTKLLQGVLDGNTYRLGRLGAHDVAAVHSVTGSLGQSGSQAVVADALALLEPRVVIAVGIAWGAHPESQGYGDVLLSTQTALVEQERVGPTRIPRGPHPEAPAGALSPFRSHIDLWSFKPIDDHPEFSPVVRDGLVLSGEHLVDDPGMRQQHLDHYPAAIGGEMEGSGVYAACARRKVDWIIVKAIADWGMGKGVLKEHQPLAAACAVDFVHQSSAPITCSAPPVSATLRCRCRCCRRSSRLAARGRRPSRRTRVVKVNPWSLYGELSVKSEREFYEQGQVCTVEVLFAGMDWSPGAVDSATFGTRDAVLKNDERTVKELRLPKGGGRTWFRFSPLRTRASRSWANHYGNRSGSASGSARAAGPRATSPSGPRNGPVTLLLDTGQRTDGTNRHNLTDWRRIAPTPLRWHGLPLTSERAEARPDPFLPKSSDSP